MLIPFGTDRPLHRPSFMTPLLIGVNIAVFLAHAIAERVMDPQDFQRLLSPLLVSGPNFRPWQLVTYAFLHAGWKHLLGNMLFLWVFGPNVEDRLTRWGFLAFYLVGGAVAGGAHALFEANPALGASGAVAAVTGAYIVLFPHTRIKCLLFFIIIGIYQIPAWFFIAFAIAKDLVFAGFANDNVAYIAHIGGYAFGILVSLVLLWRHVLSREPYDLFTIGRQAYRRRQLREATHRYQARPGMPERRPANRRSAPGTAASLPEAPADGPAAHARAAIAALLAQDKLVEAASAYKQLVEEHAATPAMCTLGRRHQLDIANHFFSVGEFEAASYAYQRFLDTYPRDAESPRVRLILGLINARYLNDPVRARQLLAGLETSLHDAAQRELANTLLVELG